MANKVSHSRAIEDYIPLVEFLGRFLGEDCEVVLHDTGNIERSVLAIANNHISGRKVGAPLTDLALKIVKDREYEKANYIIEYNTVSRDGKRLHSATYFIKDHDGRILGMLCLNMDVTKTLEARDLLNRVIAAGGFERPQAANHAQPPAESFHESIEEMTETMIRDVINRYNVPPERLTPDEKMDIVGELNQKGVFLIKGAVAVVANYLATSEATVYRYMQKTGS